MISYGLSGKKIIDGKKMFWGPNAASKYNPQMFLNSLELIHTIARPISDEIINRKLVKLMYKL